VKKARAKLRHLQHKEGHLHEYVREFQKLLLKIPNMEEEGDLFTFLDSLSGWAKTELERRGVQDPISAVTTVKSLNEYKNDFSKGRGKKNHDNSDSDRDRNKSPRQEKPTTFKDKGRDKKDKTPRKYSYFLCNGPHRVFECLKRGKLAMLVMEKERREEETSTASISFLSAIQSKVGEQAGSRMYVQTEVGGKKLQAVVDTRANKVYITKELTDEISLPYKKETGYVKGVNEKSPPIYGVA